MNWSYRLVTRTVLGYWRRLSGSLQRMTVGRGAGLVLVQSGGKHWNRERTGPGQGNGSHQALGPAPGEQAARRAGGRGRNWSDEFRDLWLTISALDLTFYFHKRMSYMVHGFRVGPITPGGPGRPPRAPPSGPSLSVNSMKQRRALFYQIDSTQVCMPRLGSAHTMSACVASPYQQSTSQ
jgi:hypothetical protein